MKWKLGALIFGLLATTGLALRASSKGWGLEDPAKLAPSVREGSLRTGSGRGHLGTRYFIGGGLHRGK